MTALGLQPSSGLQPALELQPAGSYSTVEDPEQLFRSSGNVRPNITDTTRYRINNVPLDNYAVVIGADEGQQQAPEWRDHDFEIPGAHGVFDYGADPSGPRRSYGPGLFTISGYVLGVDPATGQWMPGESFGTYLQRVSDLMRLFYARTLTVDAYRPDGTVRRAVGRLLGSLAPAQSPADPWFGRWKATIRIPAAFWTSTQRYTAATPDEGVPSGTAIGLGDLATGEAPIADPVLTFGPGNNPTLVQGGTFFAWDGVIPAGSYLVVDVANSELGYGGNPWSPDESAVRYNPGPAWFELDPTGVPAVTLNHTGGGSMYAAISARPTYLTS